MGRLQTQRGMSEIRHFESVANSKIKRNGINGYAFPYICSCGSNECGGVCIVEHVPAPPVEPKPKESRKGAKKKYEEWLRVHAR